MYLNINHYKNLNKEKKMTTGQSRCDGFQRNFTQHDEWV